MNWSRKLQKGFRALFHKESLDAQMDDEMRLHVELQTKENIEEGMNPEEARYAALREFGRAESIKETCRDQRGVSWIENLGQDIRFGARQLRKNPGFYHRGCAYARDRDWGDNGDFQPHQRRVAGTAAL